MAKNKHRRPQTRLFLRNVAHLHLKRACNTSYDFVHVIIFHPNATFMDAQADLSLCWAHMPFCWFCHEAAHIYYIQVQAQAFVNVPGSLFGFK